MQCRLCKALALMLDVGDGGKGIGEIQYFRNYKGSLNPEKQIRTIFCESKGWWDATYTELIRAAASSKLAAPKYEELKTMFGLSEGSAVDKKKVLANLPDMVSKLVEVRAGMRKGPLNNLEAASHHIGRSIK